VISKENNLCSSNKEKNNKSKRKFNETMKNEIKWQNIFHKNENNKDKYNELSSNKRHLKCTDRVKDSSNLKKLKNLKKLWKNSKNRTKRKNNFKNLPENSSLKINKL